MNATQAIQWRLSASEPIAMTHLGKVVADAAVPERIASAANTYFRHATFIGNKTARDANTSTAYIGSQSGNGTQPLPLVAGSSITISAPIGCKIDLYDLYLDVGTAGDGVQVVYF